MQAVAASLLVVSAAAAPTTFSAWQAQHGKTYSREERVMRRAIFAANVAKIEAHNAAGASWSMGVNKFADLTADEFKYRFATGLRTKAKSTKLHATKKSAKKVAALPSSVDWSAKGAVTPIKNQGQCGSCWAFSTTGSLEGAAFLATGTLPSLSEQQLVDCAQSTGNQGCNGGLMDDAFTWIKQHGGIASEAAYPYKAVDGTCNTAAVSVANVASFTDVTPNSDNDLMTAIVQQPVSVAVEADQNSFQFYTSGVMTAACGTALDHGVLAVGYGTLTGQDYYKVKNSWGADWGMAGYILLGRGSAFAPAGQCGILSVSSWPAYAAPKL